MNAVRILLVCLALLTWLVPMTASAEIAADTTISSHETPTVAVTDEEELVIHTGFHAPPLSLMLIGVAAFVMLALLMLSLTRRGGVETQLGQKSFNRGLLGVLALVISIVSILSWWLLEHNRHELRKHNQFNLEMALNTTHERLNIWVEQHKTYLEQLTHYPELLSATEQLLNVPPIADSLISSTALIQARRFIYSKERAFGKKGFFIINPDYISIGSMRDRNLGTINPIAERRADLLARVFQGETLFVPPTHSDVRRIGDSTMFFASPIRNLNGKVIAILTQRLDPVTGFSKLFDFGRIGGAAETYAFSRDGVFLSESQFNEDLRSVGLLDPGQQSSLTVSIRDPGGNLLTGYKSETERSQQPLTSMAASAVRGESGVNMRGYRDYRGVSVLGAWLWDSELNMGLAAEINVEEALSPYYLTRGSILGILMVTLLLSVGAVLFTLFTGERASRILRSSNRALEFEIKEREKSEIKLRDNEERVSSILDTVAEGIITMDDQGMIESFNPAAEVMFDYEASEVIGQPLDIICPDGMQHEKYIADYMITGHSEVIGKGREVEGKRRDGSLFPVAVAVNKTVVNGMVKFIGALHDVTERKNAERAMKESEKGLNEAQAISHIGSWEWDIITSDVKWSDELYRIVGLEPSEITPTFEYYFFIINKEDRPLILKDVKKALAGEGSYDGEFRLTRKDGEERVVHAQGIIEKDLDGNPVRMVGTTQDVTERKLVEDELYKHKEQLESLVQQRTSELYAAQQQSEAANKAKSSFLANMNHELRTPLNAILGFSDLLMHDEKFSKDQMQSLDTIHRSGNHLLNIINDILEISKIEAGYITYDPSVFNFISLINEVVSMLTPRAREKGVEFLIDLQPGLPSFVESDEIKLKQIMINLISNAIKATNQGSITLRAGLKNSDQEQMVIEVEDSGIGIAPEDYSKLFDEFVQIGDQGSQKGTGLGLPITRKFVELMGGTITFDSSLGHGSTFRIDMPIKAMEPIGTADERNGALKNIPVLAPDQSACRVLVVEDQVENQQLLLRLLERAGFETEVANDGDEGVEKFSQWHPHFIWMDLRMPKMDGIEATRRIRALPDGEAVKIVLITASTFKEQINKLDEGALDGLVHKPYKQEQVFECMKSLLGLRFVDDQGDTGPLPHVELTTESMATLPLSMRQQLVEALDILDSDQILNSIEMIAQLNPKIAAVLKEKAQNYDYEEIMTLLKPEIGDNNS